jgi:flavin-dependent dehydrogenase
VLDVAIAGGGPAGAVAALVLARAGARVHVFDRARFPRHKLCGDTVNPGALALLDRLGIGRLAGDFAVGGMLITGGRGVRVEGRYPVGISGRAILREEFDRMLIAAAAEAGAAIEEDALVQSAAASHDAIDTLLVVGRGRALRHVKARVIIAADGRHSRVARSVGLGCYPVWPRRWAVGGYFTNVAGLTRCGEMHVRPRHYLGVAPLPGGLANACVVTTERCRLSNPDALLKEALRGDTDLCDRFGSARLASPTTVLGPLAVEVPAAGVPGLLVAGDAAGFIDPMTGDGLRFAIRGGELAALQALSALEHGFGASHLRLRETRSREFRGKWIFNRALRRLVASPSALSLAGFAAGVLPSCIQAAVRIAGDVPNRRLPAEAGSHHVAEVGSHRVRPT